jgi:hypothetical protein
MDPTDSTGVMQTWLFQRFSRPDQPFLTESTLEIRGSPPSLWVERQGGDLSNLFLDDTQVAPPRVPTLWLKFPCSDLLGPCQVSPPTSGPPLENPGDRFCDGDTYPFGPPEWAPVLDDHTITAMLGIVRDSHKAGKDNPLTHEYHEGIESLFASDWNVHVNPLHPFRNLFGNNTRDIEEEFEAYFANIFFVQFDFPFRNDLYFAAGRWIIDCGHDTYHSEIHPPFVAAHMKTDTHNGQPATQANIWVNGYYTGAPVSFDIFPPPRPSPDALLSITRPIDEQAALGVNVEFSTPEFTRARVGFSAPSRQVEVTGAGEMKWEAGRAYYGRWHVYWSE